LAHLTVRPWKQARERRLVDAGCGRARYQWGEAASAMGSRTVLIDGDKVRGARYPT
jgi:hypothetical protein